MKYTNVRLKYYKENTVNIYDTIQHGIRGPLASLLGDCHAKCMNKETDPEYAGKENYIKCLDFNSLYASAYKYVTNYTIDSKKQHLETKEQYKIAIDPFDDKGIRGSIIEVVLQVLFDRFYQ